MKLVGGAFLVPYTKIKRPRWHTGKLRAFGMKLEAEDLKQIAQARKKKEAEVEIEVV